MKHVLITGAGGGLGYATALFLADHNWKVFALDYRLDSLLASQHENIIPIQVDVTSDQSILEAKEEISKYTTTLDAVVNFAGVLRMGSVAELPVSEMQNILNINLLGTYRMNQAFLDFIIKGKGRIVTISSETGVLSPAPFSGFYYLSKHAVEIYSDALRRELKYLGVPVIKIRPGAFKTNMQGAVESVMQKAIDESTHFKKQLTTGMKLAKNEAKNAKDPKVLAALIYKALTVRKTKIVYSANLNWQLKFVSALPASWQDFIYYKVLN